MIQVISSFLLNPFIIADLLYYYSSDPDPCLNIFALPFLTLKEWLFVDAYTRMAIFVAMWFFSALANEIASRKMLLICQTTLLRFYYYFLLAWTITGSYMYWGNVYNITPIQCGGSLNAYFFSVFIISFVSVILNVFVITCLRGIDPKDEDS